MSYLPKRLMTDGFINLHKPLTWTSHDCVGRMRRLLGTKKVGHGGTLDPLATGVLPVAVGRATRLLQYLPEGKAYQATIRFGVTTATDDLEGEVIRQVSAAQLSRQAVEAMLPTFTGVLDQVPPMYSAVQVGGRRLYDLARKGKAVDVPVRRVTIHQLTVQAWQAGDYPELTLSVACGPGTYIRSLARDLGEAMGMGATLAGLVRTHSSGFELTESLTLEALEKRLDQGCFEPVEAGVMMAHLRAIALPPALSRRWRLGQKLALGDVADITLPSLLPPHGKLHEPLRVIDAQSQTFLGIGEFREGVATLPAIADANAPNAGSPAVEDQVIFAAKRVYRPLG